MKLLLIVLSVGAFAQESDIDFSTIDDLREREEKVLEEIVDPIRKNYSPYEKYALKVQLKDILSSPTYRGHILRGAKLVDLKTDRQVKLTKDVFVNAHSLSDAAGYTYLQSEDGRPHFKTLANNVSNISEVTKMREPPPYYTPVVKKEIENKNDTDLVFFTEANLHLGLTSPKFTKDLLNSESDSFGKSIRYEAQAYSMFSLPFFLGLSAMAETASGDLGGVDTYSYSALSVGPIFKSPTFNLFEHDLIATLGVRSSLVGKLRANRQVGSATYRVTQTSLFLGLQENLKVKWGEITLGANFQRQWSRGKSENFGTDLDSKSTYDDSISFSIGHRMGWL